MPASDTDAYLKLFTLILNGQYGLLSAFSCFAIAEKLNAHTLGECLYLPRTHTEYKGRLTRSLEL